MTAIMEQVVLAAHRSVCNRAIPRPKACVFWCRSSEDRQKLNFSASWMVRGLLLVEMMRPNAPGSKTIKDTEEEVRSSVELIVQLNRVNGRRVPTRIGDEPELACERRIKTAGYIVPCARSLRAIPHGDNRPNEVAEFRGQHRIRLDEP
jgi:predicted nucleic acid-binding Zn ribbon protein